MGQTPESIEKGLRSKQLKDSQSDAREVDQYLALARAALAEATIEGLSPHNAYVLAHEGIHNVGMAYMVRFGVRPAGHKTIAISCVLDDLSATAGLRKLIYDSYDRLERSTYKSAFPSVTEGTTKALISALERLLSDVQQLTKPLT